MTAKLDRAQLRSQVLAFKAVAREPLPIWYAAWRKYIDATLPDTVLALLDALDEAERDADQAWKLNDELMEASLKLHPELKDLFSALADESPGESK